MNFVYHIYTYIYETWVELYLSGRKPYTSSANFSSFNLKSSSAKVSRTIWYLLIVAFPLT